ncbi:MAG: ACT domain-containing protein [Thermoflexibacter sp.]|jgi:hypothetical protein|nr:ACT domain-containing protein [Thermoflexibacter sp.]
MIGETNLDQLLKTIEPKLHEGDYIFCTVKDFKKTNLSEVILFFREEEGFTLILEKKVADSLQLEYTFISSWITLTVHSSLEAVGLTASFSKALANENISCNVVAGYFHDHIFVNKKDAEKAMTVLHNLSAS